MKFIDAAALANEFDTTPSPVKQERLSVTKFSTKASPAHIEEYSKPHKLKIPLHFALGCKVKGYTVDFVKKSATVFVDFGEYDTQRIVDYFVKMQPALCHVQINSFFWSAILTIVQKAGNGEWIITPYKCQHPAKFNSPASSGNNSPSRGNGGTVQ